MECRRFCRFFAQMRTLYGAEPAGDAVFRRKDKMLWSSRRRIGLPPPLPGVPATGPVDFLRPIDLI